MTDNALTWINLLKDIGIFGISAAIIKTLVDSSANRKLEKYKQTLTFSTKEFELKLNSSLEKYKSDISLHLNRQNKLHEKRLLVIDEMYKLLVTLDSAMREMTQFMKPIIEDAEKEEKERIARSQNAFSKYNNYFLFNKLYFNKETADLMETLRKEYFSASWDYFEPKRMQEFAGDQLSAEGKHNAHKIALDASKRIVNDIPKTLQALEAEFRKLLGV